MPFVYRTYYLLPLIYLMYNSGSFVEDKYECIVGV